MPKKLHKKIESKKALRLDFLTLFPEVIEAYCEMAILGRAQKNGLLDIKAHQLRDWAIDEYGHVDDRPFGGGAGMVMRVEPFHKALQTLDVLRPKRPTSQASKQRRATRVLLMSAKGKQFTQKDAKRLAKYDRLVFLCGRYEGIDERVADKLADEEVCIGPYVLTGGELAAMAIADSVARLRPGVLGKQASLEEESWGDGETKEYPHYTRPEVFEGWKVPKILLSGDHKKIAEWRRKNQK